AFEVLDVPEHDLRRYEADEADLDGALIAGAVFDLLWDIKNLEGKAQTRDIVEAAKAWVPAMKEAGDDIIIALSHYGIDGSAP
ncbi:hypothetical protein ACC687_40695, partial [Rhizobium ruizarguesonis]